MNDSEHEAQKLLADHGIVYHPVNPPKHGRDFDVLCLTAGIAHAIQQAEQRGKDSQFTIAVDPLSTLVEEPKKQYKAGLLRGAEIADDGKNLNMVGGSTGNAWGTAKFIAEAIRKEANEIN